VFTGVTKYVIVTWCGSFLTLMTGELYRESLQQIKQHTQLAQT